MEQGTMNQNMMGLVMNNSTPPNPHMLVNVGGSNSYIGQQPTPMSSIVSMQPSVHQRTLPPPLPTTITTTDTEKVLHRRHLQDILRNIDPLSQLDDDVEEALLQIGDDFLEDVLSASAQIAAHRRSRVLEPKDILLYLDRQYDLWIPGYSKDEVKLPKKDSTTDQHRHRLELIKRAVKR